MDVPTVVCRKCGLVQTNPRPTQEELARFYETQYRMLYAGSPVPNENARQLMRRQARSRYADLSSCLKPNSSVMEIGCATGEFLQLLKDASHVPLGVEASRECVEVARQSGAEMFAGTLETVELGDRQFDAIALFHVLEHLESPLQSLGMFAKRLRPDGLLYLEVPDVEQPYRGNLNRFFQVAHLYSFSYGTLAGMLCRAGFTPFWHKRLIEGKFLRVLARKTPPASAAEPQYPCDDWHKVRTGLMRWRRKWILWYKWFGRIERYWAAVKRRLPSGAKPTAIE